MRQITESDLKVAWGRLHESLGGKKEDYFAAVYLSREFGLPIDDAAERCAFGSYDHGLDAYHIDGKTRNLYLFQFKWSEDHNLFKDSLHRLVDSGMERVFGNPKAAYTENNFLGRLRADLNEKQGLIDRVLIVFVFKGSVEKADQSKGLEHLREDLESKNHLIGSYFGQDRPVELTFEFRSSETRGRTAKHIRKTHKYPVRLSAPLERSHVAGERLHVGFARLMDLYALYQAMGARLFERNIRFGLSEERSANRSLKRAFERIVLDSSDDPSIFAFNHNGVTLSAEHLSVEDGTIVLTEPRVLNGAQTLTSLARFVEQRKDHPVYLQNRDRLDQIEVLAKVIDRAEPPFSVGVTISTNKQNPVDPWNLRASEQIQVDLEDRFCEELSLFYERQEKSWESYSLEELEEMDIDKNQKPIQIRPLAQTLLSVQGEIDRMSRIGDVFEEEKLFRKTFPDSLLQVDLKRIVLTYKIHLRRRALLRYVEENKGPSFQFIQRGWNLLWALLIQALLNHKDLEKLAERFGKSTSMETEFTETLKTLAVNKVVPIIKKAALESPYQDQLQNEKTAFLRTKAFYQRCMQRAEDDLGWEKMGL
ncbi:MAG: hypothetical protein DIJKHBIC_01525 [Thermoanaerobaculia bacterium]|nr:hypothetical protein [Thermoanaerobaculia bacterium]